MVRVGHEYEIDRVGRKFGVGLIANDCPNIGQTFFPGRFLDVLNELVGEVDGPYRSLFPDRSCEHPGKKARACTDIRHVHSLFEETGLDDLFTLVEDLPAIPLEALDVTVDVAVFKRLIDVGLDAGLLPKSNLAKRAAQDGHREKRETGSEPIQENSAGLWMLPDHTASITPGLGGVQMVRSSAYL